MTGKELFNDYHEVKQSANYGVITNDYAKENGILLVGMNPSKDGNDVYSFREIAKTVDINNEKDFWAPKIKMMGDYTSNCGYIDLFPIRDGRLRIAREQAEIDYRGKLLSITQRYIESLKPRLIIFANTETYYWGFGHGWMGYEFIKQISPLSSPKDYWKLYKITGITPTELNGRASCTALKDSFFLQYRQHRDAFGKAVSQDKQLLFEDIRKIVQTIDPELDKQMLNE